MSTGQAGAEIVMGIGTTLNCNHEAPIVFPINTQIAMRHEALGEGTGMGIGADGDASYTLQAAHSHAVAYRTNAAGQVMPQDGIAAALNTQTDPCAQIIKSAMSVRRLMPIECERLQAFPDNYTNIPGASDTTRYKALGNSMAVNVMQLIGQRIQMVSEI
jgi:DNA (cytosine-5)-methyltransferase 1